MENQIEIKLINCFNRELITSFEVSEIMCSIIQNNMVGNNVFNYENISYSCKLQKFFYSNKKENSNSILELYVYKTN